MSATLISAEAARFKAAERVKTDRVLEFYAAAFTPDAPDTYGDVIDPHAFDEWLPAFYAHGQSLRISFNHAAVLDSLDPTNVVGYAPASPSNVWVDDYGLRVKAFLDVTSEKGRAVEYQVEKGLLTGASLAYFYDAKDRVKQAGHYLLKRISGVTEAGLVPNPANQAAVLLWLKSSGALEEDTALPYMTVEEFREVLKLDEGPWDGAAAMAKCTSAADYRRIAFERANDSDPDSAAHWALPHHSSPGAEANAKGVAAASGALNGARGGAPSLKDTGAARAHLANHGGSEEKAMEEELAVIHEAVDEALEAAVLGSKHAQSPQHIQAAHDALVRSGAKCAGVEEFVAEAKKAQEAEANDAVAARLRNLRHIELSTF